MSSRLPSRKTRKDWFCRPRRCRFLLALVALPIAGIEATPARHRNVDIPLPPLSVAFEENCGHWPSDIHYVARTAAYGIALSPAGLDIWLGGSSASGGSSLPFPIRFLGASAQAALEGEVPLPGRSAYFVGQDPAAWAADVRRYSAVRQREVYPGIDVRFYANSAGHLEYDWIVSPGSDPAAIEVVFPEARRARLTASGDIELEHVDGGVFIQRRPIVVDPTQGAQGVSARYGRRGERSFGLELHGHSGAGTLVIDPVLEYSTYLGGDDNVTRANDVAVDSMGNIIVCGFTDSLTFPIANALQPTISAPGTLDMFVTKCDPSGQTLLFSTYIGGAAEDVATSVAVDSADNIIVVGHTTSTDFPVRNAHQASKVADPFAEVVAFKLDPSGSTLLFSTYLGGNDSERPFGVAVGPMDNIYLTGATRSTDFPLLRPIQANRNGLAADLFITGFSPGGVLRFSTYLGGSDFDEVYGLAVDSVENVYVGGHTQSLDFPTVQPFQDQHASDAGNFDAFLSKVDPVRAQLVYSTYLGGRDMDIAVSVAVDGAGSAYVQGYTSSSDFPTRSARQPAYGGGQSDAFVAKFDPSGAALIYSTYLGGSQDDGIGSLAGGIAADSLGNAYVGGSTASADFPIVDAVQPTYRVGDGFLSKITSDGSRLVFSTFLGGTGTDQLRSIAVDATGDLYATGVTLSTDFPLANPYRSTLGGTTAAFVTKLACGPDTVPGDQGNVLRAARSGRDVLLDFRTAPATAWRVYRDSIKGGLGATALAPDVGSMAFTDLDAIQGAPALSFYQLKGLSPCSRTPGP